MTEVRASSNGAVASLTDALRDHARWLRTVVLARVGEPQAADDVMQEVGLAAARTSDRGDVPASETRGWAPWLYRVAVRQALLYRRKAGRARKLVKSFAAATPGQGASRGRVAATVAAPQQAAIVEPADADPLSWLIRNERRQLVRDALAELPACDAQLLLLKHTEHWSYEELARRLGISPKAVESRLARARERMRRALASRSPEDTPSPSRRP